MKIKTKVAALAMATVSLTTVALVPSVFADTKKPLYGDANTDSRVSIDDVTHIQKYGVMIVDMTEEQLKNADVNCDGKVNILDATMIQRYLAKVINDFPANQQPQEPTQEPTQKPTQKPTDDDGDWSPVYKP